MAKQIIAQDFNFSRKSGAERTREYQQRNKQAGLCVRCGGNKESDKVRCDKCNAIHLAKSKEDYDSKTIQGKCVRCGSVKEKTDGIECIKCVDRRRSNVIRRTYGLTDSEYDEMVRQQGEVCRICGKKETTRKGKLHVDHSHRTGKVRGLLCGRCNGGLGCFDDSQEMLNKAIEYLKTFDD
jgi:Recombination endonuclease VII